MWRMHREREAQAAIFFVQPKDPASSQNSTKQDNGAEAAVAHIIHNIDIGLKSCTVVLLSKPVSFSSY